MSLEVLIADDEPPARRRLRALLERVDGVAVVAEACDGMEAVEAIQRVRPGLVFLDVRMPGLSGFEVIHTIGVDAMPPVVFVTAHEEFAAPAFDVDAVDYVVKPIDDARMRRALERVLRRHRTPGEPSPDLQRVLGSALPDRGFLRRLIVRSGERLRFVRVDAIERISAQGNYVEVHADGEAHLVRDTLAHLLSQLDPARFVRVHRGEVVARDAVTEIVPLGHGDCVAVLRGGSGVRVSRRYADALKLDR